MGFVRRINLRRLFDLYNPDMAACHFRKQCIMECCRKLELDSHVIATRLLTAILASNGVWNGLSKNYDACRNDMVKLEFMCQIRDHYL